MSNEMILANQIGQAFLAELVANGGAAQEVKERMKGFSECNPDPTANNPRTMMTAFTETMNKPAVIQRLHEMRDTLPPSLLELRTSARISLVPETIGIGAVYNPGGYLEGDSLTAGGGMTNSSELTYDVVEDSAGVVRAENYMVVRDTIRIMDEGTYQIHGMINYSVQRGFNTLTEPAAPNAQTSPTFVSNDNAVTMPYKLFITVNAAGGDVNTSLQDPPGFTAPEIVNRKSARYAGELLTGKFTRNEILKGTVKNRGFSTILRLNAGDMISLQLQRGQAMATYGVRENGLTIYDHLCQIKSTAPENFCPLNWMEVLRLV